MDMRSLQRSLPWVNSSSHANGSIPESILWICCHSQTIWRMGTMENQIPLRAEQMDDSDCKHNIQKAKAGQTPCGERVMAQGPK